MSASPLDPFLPPDSVGRNYPVRFWIGIPSIRDLCPSVEFGPPPVRDDAWGPVGRGFSPMDRG